MKTISAVNARRGLGHLLNLVYLTHETVVIERSGEKMAVLTPYLKEPSEGAVGAPEGRLSLLDLAGVGSEIWVGMDADQYVQQERDQWM